MEILKQYIKEYAIIPKDGVVKVDSFLNHQIDPKLSFEIGKEFAQRFKNEQIDKIITIESSGIAPALMTAYFLEIPMVFVKKSKPLTMSESYTSKVFSFTKQTEYDLTLSKEFLKSGEKVLIIDDFLASGNAVLALSDLVTKAHAELVGAGIVIEKTFQGARENIQDRIPRIESLVRITSIEAPNTITFL
ncbi:MAG: xanthine phosphoribosyltransferase [Brevinema sp.]